MKQMAPVQPKVKGNKRPFLIATLSGIAYGLFIRFLYNRPGPSPSYYPSAMWVMTTGFLVVMPFVVGWICVASTEADGEDHWGRWITAPWIALVLGNLVLLIAGMEGVICIVFAFPITFLFATIGGMTAGVIYRNRFRHGRATTLCLAVLPLLLSGVEAQLHGPIQIRTVENTITIHATPQTIWQNIERVRPIDPHELTPTWTHAIGFPLPVEATLDHEGIGGIRHASFQHGLLFIETIDTWEPLHRIGFTIAADTANIPPTTLDEHVTVGGQFFDVLHGEYRLEPLANGDILLHLSSQQRLSTDFNPYAALWTTHVMSSLQSSILEVVKHRCEATSATLKP